jgi:hypothetical protein
VEPLHQAFIQTYNTPAHQGLLADQRLPPIPVERLGAAQGRPYPREVLAEQCAQALFPRTANRAGCVSLPSYHFSVESGGPQTPGLRWVYDEHVRAGLDNVGLAEYHCRDDGRARQVRAMRDGVLYPTRCASPPGALIPLTPQESLVL